MIYKRHGDWRMLFAFAKAKRREDGVVGREGEGNLQCLIVCTFSEGALFAP